MLAPRGGRDGRQTGETRSEEITMGNAYYKLPDGREAGYGVEATCDGPGCAAQIDRGLGHLCGQTPGGDEFGCGKYFCGEHLYGSEEDSGRCKPCLDTEATGQFVAGMADAVIREITGAV